jgi:hypothetical protein
MTTRVEVDNGLIRRDVTLYPAGGEKDHMTTLGLEDENWLTSVHGKAAGGS